MLPRDYSEANSLEFWIGKDRDVLVAESSGVVVRAYFLRLSQLRNGAYVASCGYATAKGSTGRGVAHEMCRHFLELARERGFKAIQNACQWTSGLSGGRKAVRQAQGLLPLAIRLPPQP